MQYVLTSYIEGEDEEIVSDCLPFDNAKVIFALTLKMPETEITITEGGEQSAVIPSGEEITLRPAFPDEMLDFDDGELILDNIIAEYSQDKLEIAFKRAVADFGGLVADYEGEDFVEAYTDHLKIMALREVMTGFVELGMITSDGANEDGEIRYQAV